MQLSSSLLLTFSTELHQTFVSTCVSPAKPGKALALANASLVSILRPLGKNLVNESQVLNEMIGEV